LQSQVFMVQQ